MGRDRLEEIKYRGTQVIYGDPGMLADLNWLISEVERLREALDGPIRSIACDVKQGGVLGELLIEEIEKALATAHSVGGRTDETT